MMSVVDFGIHCLFVILCHSSLSLPKHFFLLAAVNPFEGNFPRQKCYKGRTLEGCSTTLLKAYNNTDLPQSPPPDRSFNPPETYFLLFTNKNKDNPEYLDQCGGSLPSNTSFSSSHPVVIIIHGYGESPCLDAWPVEMKIQLLCRGNYNVIIPDYAWGNQLDYYDAIRNAPIVAKQTAFVITNIMKKAGISAEQCHIIGHSLGAQIAGLSGQFVYKLSGQKVGRISGLDPAGPGYMNSALDERLDASDALCVDVIHTNAGPCLPFFGYPHPMGHYDFYVNGGSVQLSCLPVTVHSFLKGDAHYGALSLVPTFCFHKQSVQYFKASINACGCQFIGALCDSWHDFHSGKCRSCGTNGTNCNIMGMDLKCNPSNNGSRVLFVETKFHCPYCDNSGIDHQNFEEPKDKHCFENCSL